VSNRGSFISPGVRAHILHDADCRHNESSRRLWLFGRV
jgi:hypothetical protein